jgi:hypothetical protein
MLILLFVRGFILLKKFKLSTFLDFQKKIIFLKTFFSFSIIKRTILLIKKIKKKKFLRYLMLPKIEFLLYFTNLVPVLSVQKNGGKNSKKRLLFDLSGS